jgi:tetratricopeptide (TPR) repeat protein
MNNKALFAKKYAVNILLSSLFSLTFAVQTGYCQEYIPIDYKQQSISAINTRIDSLYNMLIKNPADTVSRNNLAAAYVDRGNYYFDSSINLASAANDYRKAIFYLKYDVTSPIDSLGQGNLNVAKENLKKTLLRQKLSSDSKSRLKLAKSLRGQGNFKEAIVEFNESITNTSADLEIFESLGDIMRVLQKDSNAIEYYSKALALNSQSASLHLKLARAFNKTDNLDSAAKEYNLALESGENNTEIISALENIWTAKIQENPQDAVAHMNMGVVLQKKGDFTGALSQYKASELIDPTSVNLRLNLGTLFQAQGNLDMAIKAYDSILESYPTHAMTHYYRGTALRQLSNNKGAIDEFLIVLKLDPDYTPARKAIFDTAKNTTNAEERFAILGDFANSNPGDALAQYNFAYELHTKKETQGALEYYAKAVSIDPQLIDAYLNIASIYREKSQYNDAASILKKALEVNPNNKKIKNMIEQINEDAITQEYQAAIDKFNKQDYKGAIEEYLRILSTNKPTSDLYINLGSAYQADNNFDQAIIYYNKALLLDSNNADTNYYIGTSYYSKKNYSKALEYYKKAQLLTPDNKDISDAITDTKSAVSDELMEKGLKQYNLKKYSVALQLLNESVKTNPDNAYAYYYKGLVSDALKSYQSAILAYKKAIEKSKDLNVAYYSLAIDYDILKNKTEAKKAYQTFIQNSKNQNDEYVKYAKLRIKSL